MTGRAAGAGGVVRRGGDRSAWTRASLREEVCCEERLGGSLLIRSALAPEPVACVLRRGATPSHPEPGRETRQRRRYWRNVRWESRSVRHPLGGVLSFEC